MVFFGEENERAEGNRGDFWRASGGFLKLERRSKEVIESRTGIFRYGHLWFFLYILSSFVFLLFIFYDFISASGVVVF